MQKARANNFLLRQQTWQGHINAGCSNQLKASDQTTKECWIKLHLQRTYISFKTKSESFNQTSNSFQNFQSFQLTSNFQTEEDLDSVCKRKKKHLTTLKRTPDH